MSKMNKVVITEFGDESKLAIVEDDLPDPAAGEVQLSVEYSIVSGSDVNMRRGTYPFQREAPLTPGYSVLGRFLDSVGRVLVFRHSPAQKLRRSSARRAC